MKQIEISFINQTCQDIEKLNGTDFEYFCKDILDLLVGGNVQHKGHNLYAKPVKSTADFNTDDFEIVGQCGTDRNYFDDLKKPIKDIRGAIKNHPQSQVIYLFANQRATGGQLSNLVSEIQNIKISQNIEIYDSEKIAKKVILENILNDKIESLLEEYTSFAYQLYKSLPQTNRLPKFTSKRYFEREIETKIIKKIRSEKIVQIFGVSGIGKSEVSKSIVKKIQNDYETIIWVNGDDLNNTEFDFMSVHISKFNTKINLGSLLVNHKLILILDNFNENLNALKNQFEDFNKKESVCLITSLQQNLCHENSYELRFMSPDTSKQILFETDNPPSEKIANSIIEYVDGYPLVLNIIRDSVEKEDYTWEDILEDIKSVVKIEDQEKNKKIATRILERSLLQIKEELKWLSVLNSRFVSREFLKYVLKNYGINSLIKRSIMMQTDTAYYTIHQIILDAIHHIFSVEPIQPGFPYEKLEKFLEVENEKKSVGYYNFLFNHSQFIDQIYNQLDSTSIIKQQILYAIIQARDEKRGNWFLEEIKKYDLEYDTKIAIFLLIEKTEIELFNAKNEYKQSDKDKYIEICNSKIKILEKLINTSSVVDIDIYLNHHLGKIYSRIGDYPKAIILFKRVIEKDNEADYARLQIARIWTWHDDAGISREELENIIENILGDTTNWEKQSLSVLLATYELISENKMKRFREKYIDERINDFIDKLFYSLSFGFEQPFGLLAKLAYHLSYNKKDVYSEICDSLPLPATIEKNDNVKLAFATIQVAYYKLLKYSEVSDKHNKMDRTFNLAETYYQAIDLNDFQRGKFVDLYIEAEKYNDALCEIEKYDNKKSDPFYFQKLCKIYRNLGGKQNIEKAIKAIDTAINIANTEQKYNRYISAFLNDKAEATHFKLPSEAIKILEDAISKENNSFTVKSWHHKLNKWKNS